MLPRLGMVVMMYSLQIERSQHRRLRRLVHERENRLVPSGRDPCRRLHLQVLSL